MNKPKDKTEPPQPDLFGNMSLPELPKTKDRLAVHQYKQLCSIHGTRDDKRCKECIHCNQHQGGSKYFYKCDLANISHGPATDWNSRWQACGKFEQKP